MISGILCPSCGRGGTYIDESPGFSRNWKNDDIRIECHCKYCDYGWANVYKLVRREQKA